jgi:hypothetical protein
MAMRNAAPGRRWVARFGAIRVRYLMPNQQVAALARRCSACFKESSLGGYALREK